MTETITHYQTLGEPERSIIQLLAVAYEPMTMTTMVACLKELGIKSQRGIQFTNRTLAETLPDLNRLQLIETTIAGLTCTPEIMHPCLMETMDSGRFLPISEAILTVQPVKQRWGGGYAFNHYPPFLRHLRYALFKATSWESVSQLLEEGFASFPHKCEQEHPLVTLFSHPFNAEYLLRFPEFCHPGVLSSIFYSAWNALTTAEPVIDFLKQTAATKTKLRATANQLLAYHLTLWGRWQEARPYLAAIDDEFETKRLGLAAWHQSLSGHDQEAITLFMADHSRILTITGKKKEYFREHSGVFFLLSLIRRGEPADLTKAGQLLALIRSIKNHPLRGYCPALQRGLNLLLGLGQDQQGRAKLAMEGLENCKLSPRHAFFHILADYWEDQDTCGQKWSKALTDLRQRAKKGGQAWLAAEAAELLARLGVGEEKNRQLAATLREQYQLVSVIDAVRLIAPWERTLTALINLAAPTKGAASPTPEAGPGQRLVWWFAQDDRSGACTLTPRLQSRNKSGKWSAGRAVALKRLAEEGASMAGLSDQDRRICAAIRISFESNYNYGYYRHEVYRLDMDAGLSALAGHPLIFLEEAPAVRIDLVIGEPELVVTRGRKGIKVTMQPTLPDNSSSRIIKETPTRYKVVRFSGQHQAIAAILQRGLTAPGQAEHLTMEAISALSSLITIHSDLAGGIANSREVAADPKPHLHLLPYQEGLKAEILVRPLPEAEAWYQPGSGGQKVFAEVGGEKLHAARDLKLEKELAAQLLTACPALGLQEVHHGEYLIATPEESLDLLLELGDARDLVTVAWPQGETMRVRGRATAAALSLKINREREWFTASGQLTMDETGVIALQKLLALLDQAKGRFVQLDDGSFLALTQEFRNRLEELRAYGEDHGDGVRFSPLAAFALEELSQEAGEVKADRHWQKHLDHFNEIIAPEVPSTLQADLRDYQVTGFRWLSQLAHWGVGACLADDMGLGKTIQALAALLRLAPEGPTLVVAPLSVLMNWQDEASRFTPTLNPILFGPGDREQLLHELKPFDLLICSYGLLQTEAERLAQVQWQTIVLDEAQAIKNMNTKRARAAMGLSGRFKVITTGTPVENHLGELWSLFDFINPGLLGSFQRFNRTFMGQVDPENDRKTRARLKKLIQPFILRRLKSQVLQELPARTEITMRVTMGTDEATLYEAQRRLAVERLAANDDTPQGQQQIRIFAEIMRLRRLCCNPELVLPQCGIASSKLKVFGDLVAEILDNRHKALVFSQFVDHLTILSRFLDERGIRYQYLDGSTPVAARRQRIAAFQAGEGELFLISLKAGGSGLNLTAADYVIHMDPWWNPAVEDQASDRAHRIGQQRPVTIYRLVMEGSIEEQIIKLHQEKRDLADSLLSGGDLSGKLSAAELLNLLKEARG